MASVTIVNTGSMINPRDDSFSSYLNLVRDSFAVEAAASHTGRTTRGSSFPVTSSRRRSSDGEIDIFDAEKYFNGTIECKTDVTLPDKEVSLPCKKDKKSRSSAQSRSRKSAASVCSESSAGNSRTGLLLRQRSRAAKADGSKLLRVFLCNCSGEKAIDTDEVDVGSTRDSFEPFGDRSSVLDEIRLASEMRMKRLQLGFTDHDLFNGAKNLKVIEEKKVYGNLPLRKIQSTSVDVVCAGGSDGTYNRGYVEGGDDYDDDNDDITSESSSDLFEINSISIKHPFFDPVMDETAVYEPSEASIDWSVVTASAANLSSAASEFDEPRKKSRKGYHRKGLLMGCVSHKAVNATTDSYRNKLAKRTDTDTSETPSMSAQMGHERIVAPAIRYQIESLKKTESRPAPVPPQRQHAKPATRSHTRIQARQPIYARS